MAAIAKPVHRADHRVSQALALWGIFFALLVIVNGTVPFLLGADLRAWSSSTPKIVLVSLLLYAGVCLFVPLMLVKGWNTVRQREFLVPLLIAVVALAVWHFAHVAAAVVVVVLGYLHWRFDLSELGFRSHGWRGDVAAILLMGLLSLLPLLVRPGVPLAFDKGLRAGMDRLFGNPASTVENLFYFGFLTERLASKTKWFTPLLIGSMYTAHEMTNPEYWYGNMNFVLVFIGITIAAAFYVWRRSLVVTWLGDGLSRAVLSLV